MTLSGTTVCEHRWPAERDRGTPLTCVDCGEWWPGDPSWPPPYICRVEGSHRDELIANGVMSVSGMIRALKEEFGDDATG